MNKKRKIILKIWVIFILIILLILLFLLGLRLPKFLKLKQLKTENQFETQSKYQVQYIHDTNKINNIIKSLIKLKQLKESNKQQTQEQFQPINNLDFLDPQVQNELYHKLSKDLDKIVIPQEQLVETQPQISDNNNQLIKDIAVVTIATGAAIISCIVLAPILASVGPIATPIVLLL